MSYVLIYGGLRLDMSRAALREAGVRPGQHVPPDMVGRCIAARIKVARDQRSATGPAALPADPPGKPGDAAGTDLRD